MSMFLSTSTTNFPSGCTWKAAVATVRVISLRIPSSHAKYPHRLLRARELSHHQTPCGPSCPQEALSQLPPTNLGKVWAWESRCSVLLWRKVSHFTSFSCYIPPELMLTLAPTPVGSKGESVRPTPLIPAQPHTLTSTFFLSIALTTSPT